MRKKVEREENVKRKNETAVKKKGKYTSKEVRKQEKQVAKLSESHSWIFSLLSKFLYQWFCKNYSHIMESILKGND